MTTRDQPPSMWTIAGVIGAPALSAAGAAIVGFNSFFVTQLWQQAEKIATLEKLGTISETKNDHFETQQLANTVNIAEVKAANLLVETKIEVLEKELERPRPDVATARVELDALRSDFAELTKRIDEVEHKTELSPEISGGLNGDRPVLTSNVQLVSKATDDKLTDLKDRNQQYHDHARGEWRRDSNGDLPSQE